MDNGRQKTRKEPVEVAASIQVSPLPWRTRNDLGNLIGKLYGEVLEKWIPSTEKPRKQGEIPEFFDSLYDYQQVFDMAVPDQDVSKLNWPELMELCKEICEINGLQSLLWMLVPNSPSLDLSSLSQSGAVEDGQKTSSSDDSSLPELPTPTLIS